MITISPVPVVVSAALFVTAAPKMSMLPTTETVPAETVTAEVFPALPMRKLAAPAATFSVLALNAPENDALLGSSTTAPVVLIVVVPLELILSPTIVTAPVAEPAGSAPKFVVLPVNEVTTPEVPPSSFT